MSTLKKEGKKKKPTDEKVGQVKPQQGKDLTLPLHGACLEECRQPHSQIAALQIHRELAVVTQRTPKAMKVHTASHLQRVFNGASGARAAIAAASNVHSSPGESNLIARTAAMRPQTLLGLDLWATSQILFISFIPVSSATQCRAQTRTCQDIPSLQLKECLNCVSRWMLLYLHSDLLIFWPRVARLFNV